MNFPYGTCDRDCSCVKARTDDQAACVHAFHALDFDDNILERGLQSAVIAHKDFSQRGRYQAGMAFFEKRSADLLFKRFERARHSRLRKSQ